MVEGKFARRLAREFTRTISLVKRMFPDLRETRLRNSAEIHTLFLVVWEMNNAQLVLTDRRRNRIAFEMLRKLSTGVDLLRDQLKRVITGKQAQRLYQDYLLTVQGDTDSSSNRERRRTILLNLLRSLYERKDEKRTFTGEQRRIVWNSDDKKICATCKKPLRWQDFTVDHIIGLCQGWQNGLEKRPIDAPRL